MATKAKKTIDTAAALANWETVKDALRDATEEQAMEMLKAEKAGKARVQYLLRIHARMNRQRAQRERAELLSASA